MESGKIELTRCYDPESVVEVQGILQQEAIAFQLGSTDATFDSTHIGSGGDPVVIFSVAASDYSLAREALESYSLKTDLPPNHHLQEASGDEIVDILANSRDWSPFDVAHARRIAGERGIDLQLVRRGQEESRASVENGKAASKTLVFFGWLFSLGGGVIGIGIAWSICFMKEKTPEGDYFTYDKQSRDAAKPMLVLGIAVAIFFVVARWIY